ncbi:nucleotide pyrophosphohydrolase [Arthrobacter sp. MDT2-2]
MDFSDIAETLDEFAADRGWQQHHLPRSLMLALVKEVGELTELLQWIPDAQVEQWLGEQSNRDKVAAEIADVFIYLHYIARATQVDLPSAISNKIAINRAKYPS